RYTRAGLVWRDSRLLHRLRRGGIVWPHRATLSASHEPESRGGGFPHRHAGPFRIATAHPFLGLGRHQRRTKTFPDAAQPLCRGDGRTRRHGQELFPSGNLKESLLVSARIWKTWALVAIYFTTFGGFVALTAWLPTYWTGFWKAGRTPPSWPCSS